jgi:hypothetical protein
VSATSHVSDLIHCILAQPGRGVVGLVDDLLTTCREHGLQLDWRPDRCRVRTPEGAWEELPGVRLRKSAFRAILARVAAMCNERSPDSVSPYGGQGELSVGPEPLAVFQVKFTNTPAEQMLALTTNGAENRR